MNVRFSVMVMTELAAMPIISAYTPTYCGRNHTQASVAAAPTKK